MNQRFEHWSIMHVGILILTGLSIISLIAIGRKFHGKSIQRHIGYALGIILILNYFGYVVYRIETGFWELRYDLPMELCNWSMVATSIALLTKNRTFAELSYFWVMAGSVNGVITPDLQVSFPHIYFFIFFIAHSGLVIGSLYAVFGLKLYPRPWAVIRVVLLSQVYFVSAFSMSYFLGGNYGYTISKPGSGSLMDHLGPWPYYLFSLQLLGMISFTVLYLPFYFVNMNRSGKNLFPKTTAPN